MSNWTSTLYRRSSNKIEEWTIDLNSNVITVYFGEHGGKMTSKKTTIKEGKNIGKSNETTPEEQAQLEYFSKIKKKKEREGYYSLLDLGFTSYRNGAIYIKEDKEYTLRQALDFLPELGEGKDGKILPMLAKPFYKKTKNDKFTCLLDFPLLVQPKYNGMRCVMVIKNDRIELFSRTTDEITVPGLTEEIKTVLPVIRRCIAEIEPKYVSCEDIVLDGELYIHHVILADIVSAVKKPNLDTARIGFYCYDIIEINNESELNQLQRLRIIKRIKDILETNTSYKNSRFHCAPAHSVGNVATAEHFLDIFINQGFEGLIARNPYALYQKGKRTSDLLKLKRTFSGEFKIVDVFDSSKQPGLAIFKCKNDINNEYFEVVPQGNHELRRKYMNDRNNLLGKMLTVEYYERTDAPKSLPFHGVGIVVRDYE